MATTAVGPARHGPTEDEAAHASRFNAETRAAMLFLLPASIGFVVFYAYPALRGFYLSFTNFDLLRNDGDWVGLDNYKTLLQDTLFWNALWITFKYVIINIGIQTVLALAIAVLMHRLTQSVIVRSIMLMPWLIPNAVLALLWMWMLDPNLGIVNHWLERDRDRQPGLPRLREPGDPDDRRHQHLEEHGLHRAAAVRRPGDDPEELLRGRVAGRRERVADVPHDHAPAAAARCSRSCWWSP